MFTLPAAIDKGLFDRVVGFVTDLSNDGDLRARIVLQRALPRPSHLPSLPPPSLPPFLPLSIAEISQGANTDTDAVPGHPAEIEMQGCARWPRPRRIGRRLQYGTPPREGWQDCMFLQPARGGGASEPPGGQILEPPGVFFKARLMQGAIPPFPSPLSSPLSSPRRPPAEVRPALPSHIFPTDCWAEDLEAH